MKAPRVTFGYGTAAGVFLGLALVAASFADLHVSALNPWSDLGQVVAGFVPPNFAAIAVREVILTVAFAVTGVGFGATLGLLLSLFFARSRGVRLLAASLRSIHELFWALLLLQVTGISPWTGVLAVGIPYAGVFAKVFAEMMEEADLSAERVLPRRAGIISRFAYARAPILLDAFRTYTLYRLECGLRSSLILDFIGIPTIGDEIKSAFRPGSYHEAAALLLVFYGLIATRGLWARAKAVPFLVVVSLVALVELTEPLTGLSISTRVLNFLHAIVPAPIRTGHGEVASWMWTIVTHQIVPGLVQTLVLSHLAAALAAVSAASVRPVHGSRTLPLRNHRARKRYSRHSLDLHARALLLNVDSRGIPLDLSS